MNKKILLSALVLATSITANSQKFTKLEDNDPTQQTEQIEQDKDTAKEKAKKAEKKKEAAKKEATRKQPSVAAKYLEGAVPLVDGKVVWTTTVNCPGVTAQQAYERAIAFLKAYCKEKGKVHEKKSQESSIAVVNSEDHQIGARIHEDIVFVNKGLQYDCAILHYTLVVDCKADGKCDITMHRMSYTYEEDRGGGTFPAEDMLSDENALNKDHSDIRRGAGFKKFRTKTIDSKDRLFKRLSNAINGIADEAAEEK